MSSDVATSGNGAMTLTGRRPAEALKARLKSLAGDAEDNETMLKVVDAIVTADSFEAAIEAQDLETIQNGKDVADIEQEIQSFEVLPSSENYAKRNLGVRLLITSYRMDTGEEFQWQTGATNIVSLLIRARDENRLPLECVIRSKKMGEGDLLTLRLLPKRAIPAGKGK